MSIFCEVYGQCGGCSLQHLTSQEYLEQKRNTAQKTLDALEQDSALMQPLIEGDKAQRRRVELKVRVAKNQVSLGYLEKKSHYLVAITHCPVATKEINHLIPLLKDVFSRMKKPGVIHAVQLTSVSNGIDVSITGKTSLHAKDADILQEFAASQPICRFIYSYDKHHVTSLYHHDAITHFNNVAVILPYAPFLQATLAGENAIRSVITAYLKGNHIIDLYCGCGTYSLPLAQAGKYIAGYEGNYDMVVASNNAARAQNIEERIMAYQADLFKHPIDVAALKPYDSAIINPPRNGALPQINMLTARRIPQIIMVSCNPSTFQRDASHILQSGYQLISLTPIDQFYMTHHLELVGVFELQV